MSVVDTTAARREAQATNQVGRRALAVVSGPLAAAALWAVEVPLMGAHLGIRFPHGPVQVVGAAPIVAASLVAALAGWALLAFLESRTGQARRTWTALALGLLVVSLALPLAAATSAIGAVALVGLHFAVGGAVIPQLSATARRS